MARVGAHKILEVNSEELIPLRGELFIQALLTTENTSLVDGTVQEKRLWTFKAKEWKDVKKVGLFIC